MLDDLVANERLDVTQWVNGHPQVVVDRNPTGYRKVNTQTVRAACRAFFTRRGLPANEGGFQGLTAMEVERRKAAARKRRKDCCSASVSDAGGVSEKRPTGKAAQKFESRKRGGGDGMTASEVLEAKRAAVERVLTANGTGNVFDGCKDDTDRRVTEILVTVARCAAELGFDEGVKFAEQQAKEPAIV